VRLQPGVSLVGRVSRADGSPAQASIEVGDPFSMLYFSVSTGADGSFRLDDLEAGEFVVRAESARHGRARATLRGASGETLAWEARLDPGGAIRGRVLDETGAPLAGWQLQALDEPGEHEEPDFAGAESDAEGRFVLADLHARPHRVEVRPPDLGLFAVLVVNGVRPEGEELVLRVTRAELPSVWFAGSLVDEVGAPVSDARLALFHPRLSRGRVFHPDARGNFEIGPCPPGPWTLRVSSPALPECPALVLGPRALGPEEVFDCGTLVLARGARLVVEVPELAPGLEPEFSVPIEGGWPVRLEREGAGRVWRSGPLAPGSHRLQLRGRGVATAQVAFEIRRGEEPRLALALVPGIALALRVQAPASAPDLPPRLRIVDATGATVLTEDLRLQTDAAGRVHAGDYGTEVALAPGLYRVEAWFEDGPRAAAELALEPGTPAALRLELR
jgi:hypothetical protein